MIEVIFLLSLGLIWVLFATVSDLRSREIPNWLSFSLIAFALGFRFFYSLFEAVDFSLFYQGVIGLLIFLVLGNLFYYGRVFAGGDSKLMISLGAVLPVFAIFNENVQVFILFLLLFFVVGSIYGILGSLFIVIKNKKEFKKGFLQLFSKHKKMFTFYLVFGVVLLILGFLIRPFFYFALFIFIFPYFYLFIRAVDEFCMVKEVSSSKLTPGDWLYKEVKVGKKTIRANWDGLSEKEVKLLKRKKKVFVKYGIEFSPVFLISFILLWIFLEYGTFDFFLKTLGF